MILSTRKIPESGADVTFTVSPGAMSAGTAAKDHLAELFTKDVLCSLHLRALKRDIFLDGEVDLSLKPLCARCNEPFDYPLSLQLSLTLCPEPKSEIPTTDSYQESEDGVVYYRHEKIDLTEVVREQVLLSLPMRYLCSEDCLGLCEACGANLNQGPHVCGGRQPH